MRNTAHFREFARYTALNVLGMLGLSCYILADTFFVAQGMGADGLAALNLAIPVFSLIQGVGMMLGMGGATQYAILKSQNSHAKANRAFNSAALLALLCAALLFFAGVFLAEPITAALGADGAVFEMCETYLRVLLIFSPMFIANSVVMCFVRNDGAPQLAMLAMLAGSFSNILLDYIFIFPLGMGIFGAVLATGCAPVISLLTMSGFFLKGKNGFRPERSPLHPRLVQNILSCGVPYCVSELASGVVMIAFNLIALRLSGNIGVAAYGVIANIAIVVVSIFTGVAQGIQPILSRLYGTGNQETLGVTLRYALLTVAALSAGIYALVFFGAQPIAAAFNSAGDPQMQNIAVQGLKIYFVSCVFAGFNIIVSAYFSATEYARPAFLISLLRGFIVILPTVFLLSTLWGMVGVWCALPVTEAAVALAALAFYRRRRTR